MSVWAKSTGFKITSMYGWGGGVNVIVAGAGWQHATFEVLNLRTGEAFKLVGSGVGVSIGPGVSPVKAGSASQSDPQHNTISTMIFTQPQNEIVKEHLARTVDIYFSTITLMGASRSSMGIYWREIGMLGNMGLSNVAAAMVVSDGRQFDIVSANIGVQSLALHLE